MFEQKAFRDEVVEARLAAAEAEAEAAAVAAAKTAATGVSLESGTHRSGACAFTCRSHQLERVASVPYHSCSA